jgi:iron(III) transport system ATP-binding protein
MSTRAALSVSSIRKVYADGRSNVAAVNNVSFNVQEGEFFTLLGPSGCGKTTTLRCIAGLERIDAGSITIGDQTVSSHRPPVFVPPHRRGIGMVFQSYAIWPHMNVSENVAFPLQVGSHKPPKSEVERRVREALELVQLDPFADRMSTQLSGGQQQRLALARALVRQPRLLLLDEPLSNLDAKLRERMRAELRDLQGRLGLTTIYVTHDQMEALSMSSRIVLMNEGRVVQEGTPRELYQQPASRFVASFLGNSNLLDGEVLRPVGGRWLVQSAAGQLAVHCPAGVEPGSRVCLTIRPEDLSVLQSASDGSGNVLPGVVESITYMGDALEYRLGVGTVTLTARGRSRITHLAGASVWVHIPDEACTVLSDEHGASTRTFQHPSAGGAGLSLP